MHSDGSLRQAQIIYLLSEMHLKRTFSTTTSASGIALLEAELGIQRF